MVKGDPMGMSDLSRVSSFQDIGVCPAQKPQGSCLLKGAQAQGGGVQPVCYSSSQVSPDSWYLTLSQFNSFVPALLRKGYKEICRSPAEMPPNRYALYLSTGTPVPAASSQVVQPALPPQTQQVSPQVSVPTQPGHGRGDFFIEKVEKILGLGIVTVVPIVLGIATYIICKQSQVIKALRRQLSRPEERPSFLPPETKALGRFGINLNERFQEGYMEPLNMGLHAEEMKKVRVALQKKRNFVMLSGEEGVGKSALVEMLASGIEMGVYPELEGVRVISVNLDAVEAGTTGDDTFEKRLQEILNDAYAMNRQGQKIVLFFDGIHRIMGTSNSETSLEGFKILKAALVHGDITILGSTTKEELDKIFTLDSNLAGRIYNIPVRPLTAAEAVEALVSRLSRIGAENAGFPQMRITPDALDEVVFLASEFIGDTAFPEKAEDLLREAVAFKRTNCASKPALAQDLTAADVHAAFEHNYHMTVPTYAEYSNIWPAEDFPIMLPDEKSSSPLDTASPYATLGFDFSKILESYVGGQLSKEKWYRDLLPNRQTEVVRSILVMTHQAEFRMKYMADGKVKPEGILEALKAVDVIDAKPASPVRVEASEEPQEKSGPKGIEGRFGESVKGKIPGK
jgi:energy-coupling factor transporter ATP-binding protein EcfA2